MIHKPVTDYQLPTKPLKSIILWPATGYNPQWHSSRVQDYGFCQSVSSLHDEACVSLPSENSAQINHRILLKAHAGKL